MKEPRKPIQISITSDEQDFINIVALCDDGTIWAMITGSDGSIGALKSKWAKLPPIPKWDDEK